MEQTIKFTDDERKILIELLLRTNLTGAEVPAYLKIVKKLNEPLLDELKDNKKVK